MIGKEQRQGKWPVYLDEISKDNSKLVAKVVEIKDKDGEQLDDIDIQTIIAENESYRIVLKRPQENVMTGDLLILNDEASASKNLMMEFQKSLKRH